MVDLAANNKRVTCKTAGLYNITAGASFGSGSGSRVMYVKKNGSVYLGTDMKGSTTLGSALNLSLNVPLAVGDYIEVALYQDSGASVNTSGGGQTLQLTKIGDI
jgi:hypothetical protein